MAILFQNLNFRKLHYFHEFFRIDKILKKLHMIMTFCLATKFVLYKQNFVQQIILKKNFPHFHVMIFCFQVKRNFLKDYCKK